MNKRAIYFWRLFSILLTAVSLPLSAVAQVQTEDPLRLTDKVLPFEVDTIPTDTHPLLELGDPFLDTGAISKGFELPTGAVWQPSLMVWGIYRTALQVFDDGTDRNSEWANRLDLFSNLSLTQTERIFAGIRPLDRNGRFSGYTFESPNESDEERFDEELNAEITSLFFEGDFGELFPVLDPKDKHGLDVGMAVGRQPISFQDGILVNDSIDSLGLTKINLKPPGVINHRATILWGWNELNRNNLSTDDGSAQLFGTLNEFDIPSSTVELDLFYVDSDETGDGFHGGAGATQRIGKYNTTFRALASHANGTETDAVRDGELAFGEVSRTLQASQDIVYLNGFWAIDQFRSASRAPNAGGPLASAGILFEAVGLGRFRAPLDNGANDALGAAVGYQLFSSDTRWQTVFELGGRYATESVGQRATAAGVSFQSALGTRSVVRIDLFGLYGAERRAAQEISEEKAGFGARLEWLFRL